MNKKKIIGLILAILICKTTQGFNTLQQIKEYTAAYPEQVKSDNNDWVDPEFKNFYKKYFSTTWFDKILRAMGLQKKSLWNVKIFEDQIKKITNYRQSMGLKAPYKKTITLNEKNSIYLFGDLQGALHSFARDLGELKRLGVIDEYLNLKKKNVYIVIIGDAVSRSPYSLELLTIILNLMRKNPKNIIYLRGKHEKKHYWQNFSMERELKYKVAKPNKDELSNIPLSKEINAFFNTLPDTLIVKNANYPKEKISISHTIPKEKKHYDPDLKFIIIGEKRSEVLKETTGLEFLGYHKGAAKWSVISCPTYIYQKFFNFHYDAFVEITFGKDFESSILTLYNHKLDTTTTDKQYKETHYDPIFGFTLDEKKSTTNSRNVVKVGSSMYLTGINWDLGKEIKSGIETALYQHNKKRPNVFIRPFFLDDEYNPRKTYLNIDILNKKHGIDKILMPTGTPTLGIYLDKVKKGKIAVFFPATGAQKYRKPELKNIVHLRSTYIEEAVQLLNFLIKQYGIKRFALFYQLYGAPIAKALHKEMRKNGITKWLDLPHLATQEDFSEIAEKIKHFTPEAIGCFSSQLPTQRLISALGSEFFLKHLLFMPPSLYTRNFRSFLENRGIKFAMVSMLPDPLKSNLEIAKEHLKAMKERGLTPTIHSLSGYIAGTLFVDAVNNIKAPITKEKLISYFENMKNRNFKGVKIKFKPETRSLTSDIWIKSSEGGWTKNKSKAKQENKRK